MEFAFDETQTEDEWAAWSGTNVEVVDGGIEIAREALPTYESPDPLVAEPPSGFHAVDLDVDPCGDPHVLTAEGDIYRYDRRTDRLQRLPCTWQAPGQPTGIAVTRETIYVVSDRGVQAFSKHLLQTRWIVDEPFDAPVAAADVGKCVLVLDAGDGSGTGFLTRLEPDARSTRVVEGIESPVDLAVDGEGAASVLTMDGASELIRFDAAFGETATISPPEDATCLAVGGAGETVVGTSIAAGSETSLYRYRLAADRFESVPGFDRPSDELLLTRADDILYVIDGDGQIFVLEERRRYRLNPVTDRYDARIARRFDAGNRGTEWHRVTLDRHLGGAGTQVRLAYHATDDGDLRYGTGATDLEAVDGIGPTYADRLRDAGVADLADLLELAPEQVSSIVSTEILDVPPDRTGEWLDAAQALIADRPDGGSLGVETVDGIGPVYGERLREAGIDTLADLVAATAADLARIVSRELITVPASRTEAWIEEARRLLAARNDVRAEDWRSLSTPNPTDALLDAAEGRYLWVQIELVGDANSSPRVDAFRAYFPRQSYLRHLPAIYREDRRSAAFLERFLSIFESGFTDIEEEIGAATRYLDADGVPADYLSWLGEWLAIEAGEAWPAPAKRELLDRAPELFRKRGTREGLLEILRLYLDHVEPTGLRAATPTGREPIGSAHAQGGDEAVAEGGARMGGDGTKAEDGDEESKPLGEDRVYVFEHADLDCIDDPDVRERYEEIVPCPQCFLVFVRSVYDDAVVETIEAIVEAQQPAHATGRTVQLRPGIELGGNSFLGINTTLPDREFVLERAALGKDTVFREREQYGQLGVKSRLGTDANTS